MSTSTKTAGRSALALAAMIVPLAASAKPPAGARGKSASCSQRSQVERARGARSARGGALYVPQPATGRDLAGRPEERGRRRSTRAACRDASPCPTEAALPFGGVMDVAFYGSTAYALVSVVGPSFPADLFACHPDLIGVYRVNGPSSSTLVADIGSFACDNAPTGFPIAVPTGVQYALEPFRGGFLVTDGHHNRVYRVTLDGTVTQMIQFEDVVPTGLAVSGNTIYMAETGPVPHLPQNGKIVSFEPGSSSATPVACRRSTRSRRRDGPRTDAVRALTGPLLVSSSCSSQQQLSRSGWQAGRPEYGRALEGKCRRHHDAGRA